MRKTGRVKSKKGLKMKGERKRERRSTRFFLGGGHKRGRKAEEWKGNRQIERKRD